MTKYPTLYKRTTTGAVQEWEVAVHNCTITTRYGQVGGKTQVTNDVLRAGKGGRTAEQQARLEAGARWEKQRKKGYVEDLGQAQRGEVNCDVIAGGVAPMLAQKFAEHGEKITYPAFIQRKYDGVRCIATIEGGKATLWSRTRKPIESVPHVVRALEAKFAGMTVILDGELYVHGMDFERLVSIVRPKAPIFDHTLIEYHIYDLVGPAPFSARVAKLAELMTKAPDPLRLVQTWVAGDLQAVTGMTESFISEGYEGSIVRQAATPYEVGKRSYGLQKVKTFSDAEYQIVGVEEGRGRMAGCAIFICRTPEGRIFNCKLEGSIEGLRKYLTNSSMWLGKSLTVRYQNLTKEGIPRFPVGVAVRDYEG